ncbi:oligosaccharide flippase family protein [Rugamonas sp. FT107W]|uniref:Oligosaccharide flippase family protein n=1 Tax=Duganella vulcania TaxID=2692166 RepID=A0A845HLA2_9BURK|nr:beta-1,6-N-acetylglucosaminyltransferase [Duganella vulcania]MYN17674.1 oligosaccharide flippase family protein [Duganella vulcania]
MGLRYGRDRVVRGLLHFLLGKGISSIAGFLGIVLVIRLLPVDQFASYSVLVALVETLTAVSGLGLAHALLRYVPELYAQHYQQALRRYVGGSVMLRSAVLLLATLVAFLCSNHLAPLIGLGDEIGPFRLFLLLVFVRSTSQFLSQILESTLHQANAQFAFSLSAVTRLAGMLYLSSRHDVRLMEVIWVEVASDALGLAVMLYGVLRMLSQGAEGGAIPDDDAHWLRRHLRQIGRFALAGYAQHLAILPYGGNTNRLVGGRMLADAAMASYGFAQSLYEYVKRYLPAQLLVGLIRPVVVARYAQHRDFADAARMSGKVLQINMLCIGAAFVGLAVGGPEAIKWMSAGKYGTEVAVILLALFIVLLLETQRQQLELLVQTVEIYKVLIPSNVVLAASVLLAVLLLPAWGAVSFPVANIVGLVIANAWVQRRMDAFGFRFRHDWISSAQVLGIIAVATLVGLGLKEPGMSWYLAALLSGVVYSVLGYFICGDMVRDFVSDLTGSGRKLLPPLEPAAAVDRPTIAFGVLSSKQSTAAVEQIAAAVHPHPVYVHHDFSKQPDFAPRGDNITLLEQPVTTAWGDWSLVEATYRLMARALANPAVTHFQLLSESCLPLQDIARFEAYLLKEQPDAMIDILPVSTDQILYSHGWRYLPRTALLRRIGRRASTWVAGNQHAHRDLGSLNLSLALPAANFSGRVAQWVGRSALRLAARSGQRLLDANALQGYAIGAQWFGANRRTVQWLLLARQALPAFTAHYQRCHIPDESYVHTLLHNAVAAGLPLRMAPANHALYWDGNGTGPDLLTDRDYGRLSASGKYFGRKFDLDPATALRRRVLDRAGAAGRVSGAPH